MTIPPSAKVLDVFGLRMAKAAYENVFEGDQPLARRFLESGVVGIDDIRFATELIVWSLFIFDIMLSEAVPEEVVGPIRGAMIRHARDGLSAAYRHNSRPELGENEWQQLIIKRFSEYQALLPTVDERGPVNLAGLVSTHLTGQLRAQPEIALPILVTLDSTRKHITPAIRTQWERISTDHN